MAFWGVEVKPGKPFTHETDAAKGRLHVSQATLGIGIATKKSVVQCNVGNASPVFLCSLFPEKAESCQLNLEFDEADEVVFSVLGPRSVHLTGYFLASARHRNFPDESESYGEDIADSETERSAHNSDEDSYEDSFIDDGDPEVFPASPISSNEVIEDTLDKRKTNIRKGRRGRLRKKYQLIESDDYSGSQGKKNANDHTGVTLVESENEDNLPISSLYKSNAAKKHTGPEAEEIGEKAACETGSSETKGETGSSETKGDGNCVKTSAREAAAAAAGEPRRVGPENGAVTKKKRKEKSKEQKPLEAGGKSNKEDHKTADENRTNLPHLALPFTNAGTNDGATPKKKKKEKVKEDSVVKEDMAEQDKVKTNNQPTRNGRNHSGAAQFSRPVHEDFPENSAKPAGKRKRQTEGGTITADGEVNSDGMDHNRKQGNNKIFENATDQFANETQPEKKKKKKKKRIQEQDNMEAVNMEIPIPSMDEKNSAEFEGKNADNKICQPSTLSNELVIEELETGKPDGKIAASGKKIFVNYVAKLMENGQVFDSNTGGSPIKFRLGKGSVIEGWNIGIDGMHVGGKRRLIVPPSLGYGSEGNGENVPPNSWLIYDIELVKVR